MIDHLSTGDFFHPQYQLYRPGDFLGVQRSSVPGLWLVWDSRANCGISLCYTSLIRDWTTWICQGEWIGRHFAIRFGGVQKCQKWGIPNSWMVFVMENPNLKWMMSRGTPMTSETPIWHRWNDFGMALEFLGGIQQSRWNDSCNYISNVGVYIVTYSR